MTSEPNPFNHERDPAIARLLRNHLDAADHAVFTSRVRDLVREVHDTSWDVLARWARPGMAVAAGAGVLLGLWLRNEPSAEPAIALEETIRPAGAPAQLFTSGQPPTGDVVLSAVMNAR